MSRLAGVLAVSVALLALLIFAPAARAQGRLDCADSARTGLPPEECRAVVAIWDASGIWDLPFGAGSRQYTGHAWLDAHLDRLLRWWQRRAARYYVDSPCQWHGVTCQDGHVAELWLSFLTSLPDPPEVGLTALPSEIGQLAHLRQLDLSGNRLTALPPEIGQLTRLIVLDLAANRLEALPPEIGHLSDLVVLNISYNALATLPPEIGQLANLQSLQVHGNQLRALPPEIGQLASLEWLYANDNQLTALPVEITRLAGLQGIDVCGNPALTFADPAVEAFVTARDGARARGCR